ncbi:MAG: hypothetical protein M3H12_08840 [Chromatiales bacterium]|nr:hypothetical protein [Gammaproteobacteria bacterium]
MLSLYSDLGAYGRSLNIKSPATDSPSDPFVFATSNSIDFAIDTDKHFLIDDVGDVFIENASPKFTLKDITSTTEIDFSGFIDFVDSTDVRMGYMGYPYSTSRALYVRNEIIGGELSFCTEGFVRATVTASGELLVGYTVDQGAYKLQVNGAALIAGDVDVTGTLRQAGVEVATLQSLLDGVGLGKSLAANGYATLPGGLIIQWGLTRMALTLASWDVHLS